MKSTFSVLEIPTIVAYRLRRSPKRLVSSTDIAVDAPRRPKAVRTKQPRHKQTAGLHIDHGYTAAIIESNDSESVVIKFTPKTNGEIPFTWTIFTQPIPADSNQRRETINPIAPRTALDIPVAAFPTHDQPKAAIAILNGSGFDMKHLSIIGQNDQTADRPEIFVNSGDRMLALGIARSLSGLDSGPHASLGHDVRTRDGPHLEHGWH